MASTKPPPTRIKPYLDVKARLSQIWINRWTVLLLLVLVRVFFAFAGANSNLMTARREALRACTEVENVGSSMASMPHYMAAGVNELTAGGIENAVNGLMTVLEMVVSGVEEMILFVVHMMTSTYLCLITLAVRGSMEAVGRFSSTASEGLHKTVNEVTDSLRDTSETLSDGLNSIMDKIEHIPGLQNINLPTADLTDQINSLQSIEIPQDLLREINGMNGSIPTFEDVQEFVDNIVRIPFEQVKKQFQNMSTFHLDRALLPVPRKEHMDFCTKNNSISEFFEDLLRQLVVMRNTIMIVLIVLAVLFCIPLSAWAAAHRNKKIDRAKIALQQRSSLDSEYLDPLLHAHPSHLSSWALWISQRCRTNAGQNSVRWLFAYTTSPPMLFVLTLGVAGLLSCAMQWLLVRRIHAAAPRLTSQVADFAGDVMRSLQNSSASWSNGVNQAIQEMDKQLNRDVFNAVNTTTTSINSTLDAFVQKTSTTLDTAFGGTILHEPMEEVINCLIGLKIASFQKGLTWVNEHARISFPPLRNDTFTRGALAQLGDSHSAAELLATAKDKASDGVTEALNRVVNRLVHAIHSELLISGIVVGCWLLIIAGGAIYISVALATEHRNNKNRDNNSFPFSHSAASAPGKKRRSSDNNLI
jgi:hypothetical protein